MTHHVSIVLLFIYRYDTTHPLHTISLLFISTAMHDAYCEAKSYRIILEFMNGGDLLDILEAENSLDEVTARSVCYSLMSAITHLHSHSIAHR